MKKLLIAVLCIGSSVLSARAQKPILPDFHADPSARVFNGKLYIYPTHDLPNMVHSDEVDWHVFSSDDMTKWTDYGVIFKLEDTTWAKKEAWAPDCIERQVCVEPLFYNEDGTIKPVRMKIPGAVLKK